MVDPDRMADAFGRHMVACSHMRAGTKAFLDRSNKTQGRKISKLMNNEVKNGLSVIYSTFGF